MPKVTAEMTKFCSNIFVSVLKAFTNPITNLKCFCCQFMNISQLISDERNTVNETHSEGSATSLGLMSVFSV